MLPCSWHLSSDAARPPVVARFTSVINCILSLANANHYLVGTQAWPAAHRCGKGDDIGRAAAERPRRSSERSSHTEGVGYLGQQNGVTNGHPASCAGLRPQNHGSLHSAAFDHFLGKSLVRHDRHPLYDSVRHNSQRPGEPMESATSSSESNKGGGVSGRVALGFGCVA